MTLMKYLLKTRPSMLGEDDGEILATSSIKPPGYDLKRIQWIQLNCLWSGHGRCASFMHRIGLSENANCICSAIQTPQHVLNCSIIGIRGDLRTVDKDFRNWIGKNKLLEL